MACCHCGRISFQLLSPYVLCCIGIGITLSISSNLVHCSDLLYMCEYFLIFSYFLIFFYFSDNLSSLVESQPRSKKSRRCVLHSLDSQRSRAVVTDQWRDAWDRMKPLCKDEVLLIEASALLSTLNNYLHKHRYE